MASKKPKRRRRKASRPKKAQPSTRAQAVAQAVEAVDAAGLTAKEHAFVLAYNQYLGNGTRAWMSLHPDCTRKSAGEEASRLLSRNVKVRLAINASRKERWKRLEMDADEALALVANDARVDVRDLFDDDGNLLKPHLWPDDIAASVESVDMTNGKVKLAGKSAARRTILEQTGTLKGVGAGLDSLAKILAGNFEEEAKP